MTTFNWRKPRTMLVMGTAALLAAACGSGSSSGGGGDSSGGLPSSLTVPSISEVSGFAGPAGQASVNGQKVAVQEINDTKFLGGTTLTLDYKDTGSQAAQGVALLNQAITAKSPVVLGSILSTNVAAEAPLAQRSKISMLYLSSDGQFASNSYVWASTPPAAQYFHWETEYLKDKGVKNVAMIYNPDVSATKSWNDDVLPPLLKDAGLTLVADEGTPTSASDASGVVSKVMAKNPDAVIVLASGTANNAIVLALKRAQFDGIIAGSIGMAGAINPLGAQADGVVWPTNFSTLVKTEQVTKFVDLYKKQFNAEPNNYAAAAYDQIWFLARALKEANSTNREDINKALQSVGDKGFDGALGQLTYKDNVAQAAGLLIEWTGGKEVPIKGYGTT